ncbi:MAG: PaaI family thioesterase [Anaerolineales bacterium]|nr:PaaI family thioesterase [Anaerolineales bacterium]
MDFYTTGDGEVMAEHIVPEVYQGYPGVVHGGITAAMLDETAGRVVITQDDHSFFMTLKIEVKYRKPVPTETPLRVVGRLKTRRGSRVSAHSEIILPDGQVAAEAEALLTEMPGQMLGDADLEALGWKIFDE